MRRTPIYFRVIPCSPASSSAVALNRSDTCSRSSATARRVKANPTTTTRASSPIAKSMKPPVYDVNKRAALGEVEGKPVQEWPFAIPTTIASDLAKVGVLDRNYFQNPTSSAFL